jgi:1-phosphatidylinositol-3-phosphate 5-kinase
VDRTLGEAIRDLVEDSGRGCVRRGCEAKRGEHEVRYVHGSVRVGVNVRDVEVDVSVDAGVGGEGGAGAGGIRMWESCAVCNAHTKKRGMSDGT